MREFVGTEVEIKWGFGNQKKYATFRVLSNEVLLCSTGNYIQSLVMEHDGKEYEKRNVSICMTGSIFCTAEIYRTF